MQERRVEQLALEVGTSVRNIRLFQTKGLLPPPRVVGRVGYYSDGHVARIRLILRLQHRGFSLAAIGELLSTWQSGQSLSDLLGFEEALTRVLDQEIPEEITLERARELFPSEPDLAALAGRAARLGLVEVAGETIRVRRPSLLRIGIEMAAIGIPASVALDEFERLRANTDGIAARFLELFREYVWEPFVREGRPAGKLAEITRILNTFRPLARTAVGAVLADSLEDAIDASTAEQFREIGERTRDREGIPPRRRAPT